VLSPKYSGRLRPPAAIEAHGEDELAALTDLAIELRELRGIERRMALEEKARQRSCRGRSTRGRHPAPPVRTRS
jgi:hypothetical protein